MGTGAAVIDAQIVSHEAGHAAAYIFLGRLPVRVRVDNPSLDSLVSGHVEFDFGEELSPEFASDLIVAVMLGPMCGPLSHEPWPPPFEELDHDHPVKDARQLALLARFLRLDEAGYRAHVANAQLIASDHDFKALHRLLARALHRIPDLDADQLRRLLGPQLETFHLEAAA